MSRQLKPSTSGKFCEQKERLVDLYNATVAVYSKAVADIHQTRGKTSKAEYGRLQALAEEARATAESARLALEWHTLEHDC